MVLGSELYAPILIIYSTLQCRRSLHLFFSPIRTRHSLLKPSYNTVKISHTRISIDFWLPKLSRTFRKSPNYHVRTLDALSTTCRFSEVGRKERNNTTRSSSAVWQPRHSYIHVSSCTHAFMHSRIQRYTGGREGKKEGRKESPVQRRCNTTYCNSRECHSSSPSLPISFLLPKTDGTTSHPHYLSTLEWNTLFPRLH